MEWITDASLDVQWFRLAQVVGCVDNWQYMGTDAKYHYFRLRETGSTEARRMKLPR